MKQPKKKKFGDVSRKFLEVGERFGLLHARRPPPGFPVNSSSTYEYPHPPPLNIILNSRVEPVAAFLVDSKLLSVILRISVYHATQAISSAQQSRVLCIKHSHQSQCNNFRPKIGEFMKP